MAEEICRSCHKSIRGRAEALIEKGGEYVPNLNGSGYHKDVAYFYYCLECRVPINLRTDKRYIVKEVMV